MMVSKRNLLFQGLIFRFHAKLQGCKCPTPSSSPTLVQASKLVLLRFQVPRPENFTKLRSVTLDETYWLFIWLFHRDPDDGLLYYTIIPILLCSITPEITPLTARLFFSLLISPPQKKKHLPRLPPGTRTCASKPPSVAPQRHSRVAAQPRVCKARDCNAWSPLATSIR